MAVAPAARARIKIADEVFIATVLLHQENPLQEDFTISEIVDRVAKENLFGELRPGVRVHTSLHCVANKAPNPERYRMLYATAKNRRRLLAAGDEVHPGRTGKMWPDSESIPPKYSGLIDWAKQRFGSGSPRTTRWMEGILELRGLGRELWRGQDPDDYVRELRESWE